MLLGAGPTELMVIFVLALIILGPKRLPEVARALGKALAEFKKMSQGLQSAVQKDLIEPMNSVGDEIEEIKEDVKTL